jgi:2-polyprenyl-6-hydroxyphenyl methylase/3-demethylubiquinone-9 3-methyltransferase
LHSYESGIFPDYKNTTIEQLAIENDDLFDVVTCLEMLEHVPNPESVIYSCFKLLKPNGSAFFSTINRNPKSFLFAIIGAEHLLKLLPKGTHQYQKLIKPSELAVWCRKHNFSIQDISGMVFNPIFQTYKLSSDVDVNYIVHCKK